MDKEDYVLSGFKQQCEGKPLRIGSKTGPIGNVLEVFRNPDRNHLIDVKVQMEDLSINAVPLINCFIV